MNRIANVVRLHLANRWSWFVLPWIVLASAVAVTLAVWFVLALANPVPDYPSGELRLSAAVISLFGYELVLAVQSVTTTFPSALGMSPPRREFFLGTASAFVLLAAATSIALTALAVVEQATDGWGLQGRLFTILPLADDSLAARWFSFFVLQLFFAALGGAVGAVYMRWRTTGMVVLWIGGSALLVSAFAFVSLIDGWTAIGGWLAAIGLGGILSLTLAPTTLLATGGWLVLRRATPRG